VHAAPGGLCPRPAPKAFALAEASNNGERRSTDEVAVMIDTRFAVDLAAMPPGVENLDYVDSWKRQSGS